MALAPFVGLTATTAVLSHLFADALTPMGVTPFTPFSARHISYNVVKAKNRVANYLFLVAGLAAQTVAHRRVGARDA